jgi:hypothetical protein
MFNSADKGPYTLGYTENFAWGTVDFGGGTFVLDAQDDGTLGALYTGIIAGIDVSGDYLHNFSGDNNMYYLPDFNLWLEGKTYGFAEGKGMLMPARVAPEPVSGTLFLIGGAGLLLRGRSKRRQVTQ